MTNSLLLETLSTINIEFKREGKFNQSFELVSKLLSVYGEKDLAKRLFDEIPSGCSWKVVADLFCILTWSMTEEGASELIETTEKWLIEGNDVRKVQIGLHLDTYPFHNKPKMVEVLSTLSHRYPDISSRCDELINSRPDSE